MSTSDNVFVATGESVADVAGWLAGGLGLEAVVDADLRDDERLFRRSTRTGVVGVLVRPNGFAVIDPEPDEIQAIDRYPIDVQVRPSGRRTRSGSCMRPRRSSRGS